MRSRWSSFAGPADSETRQKNTHQCHSCRAMVSQFGKEFEVSLAGHSDWKQLSFPHTLKVLFVERELFNVQVKQTKKEFSV